MVSKIDIHSFSVNLAERLDELDGKKDNHIQLNIWNNFAKSYVTTNTKQPKSYMSVFTDDTYNTKSKRDGNAITSIMTYMRGKSDNEIQQIAKQYDINITQLDNEQIDDEILKIENDTEQTLSNIDSLQNNTIKSSNLVDQIYHNKGIKVNPSLKRENIEKLNDTIKQCIIAEGNDLASRGMYMKLNQGWRSESEQQILRKRNPVIADTPEHSQHTKGNAFDRTVYYNNGTKVTDTSFYLNLDKKHGLVNGRDSRFLDHDKIQGEWWHAQLGLGDGYLIQRKF